MAGTVLSSNVNRRVKRCSEGCAGNHSELNVFTLLVVVSFAGDGRQLYYVCPRPVNDMIFCVEKSEILRQNRVVSSPVKLRETGAKSCPISSEVASD